jgi:5S rRNA maturation endonuclease (ribonuclease M5)
VRVLDAYGWLADAYADAEEARGGAEVYARCPLGHDAARVRFSLGDGGRLLVRCFRCGPAATLEILRAVGRSYKDCFPGGTDWKAVPQRAVARYPYRDEAGVTLYETVRLEPGRGGRDKEFRQRRPNPGYDPARPSGRENPRHLYNLDGVRRVLYRLPELLAADPRRVALVVAGEKDCDHLAAVGVLATTNVCGERAAWLPEYSRCLAGRDVVVVPDADAAGRRHADEVCGSLMDYAASVRKAALPEKDATAFLMRLRRAGVTRRDDLRRELWAALAVARRWAVVG